AEPGTVLVGAATHRLVEPLFDWGERQELTLRGKAGTVLAYSAQAARSAPGKGRGIPGVQARLVGREPELGIGRLAVDEVLGGSGGILFISGEAGIGKSRLMLELQSRFTSSAEAPGRPIWLEGRWVSDGVARRRSERLAEECPAVLAVEELPGADPTSVQLVERLLPMTEDSAVLLVIAARQERDHPSWAVKEAAAREFPRRMREAVLEALSGEADRELLSALIGPGVLPEPILAEVLD